MKHMRLIRRIFAIIGIVFLFCACGEKQPEQKEKTVTGEMVPVAVFSALSFELSEDWYCSGQETSETARPVLEGQRIICSFADSEGCSYLFLGEEEADTERFLLRKQATNKTLLWEHAIVPEEMEMGLQSAQKMLGGGVDAEGNVCIYNYDGILWFFNRDGKFLGRCNAGMKTAPALAVTRDNTLFLYSFTYDETAGATKLLYAQVIPGSCSVSQISTFFPAGGEMVQRLWGGEGDNLLYVDGSAIWQLQPNNGTVTKLLSLDSAYVNIEGQHVQAIYMMENGEFVLYLYDEEGSSMQAQITLEDKGLLPEKERVTLGITAQSSPAYTKELRKRIKAFNRQSNRYYVELIDYFPDATGSDTYFNKISMDILKGNAPDILEVSAIAVEQLADKDFFVNLEPYFEKSTKVGREDLLESVWEAGMYDGDFCFVMPWFMVETQAVTKESLAGRPWNLDTLQALAQVKSDADMLLYLGADKKLALLQYALTANCERFYHVETKNCSFTDGRFTALLECINEIDMQDKQISLRFDQNISDFRKGKLLTYNIYLRKMEDYQKYRKDLGDEAVWTGYPSDRGAHHRFQSFLLLGVTQTSQAKEGAWAFLEYLLSEETQCREPVRDSCFPVRKQAFEQYISVAGQNADGTIRYADEELRRGLREVVDNTYLQRYRIYDPLYDIIIDESRDCFSGEKTANQVAEVIENRMRLYLEENF